jgi:hypothetical protein
VAKCQDEEGKSHASAEKANETAGSKRDYLQAMPPAKKSSSKLDRSRDQAFQLHDLQDLRVTQIVVESQGGAGTDDRHRVDHARQTWLLRPGHDDGTRNEHAQGDTTIKVFMKMNRAVNALAAPSKRTSNQRQ